MMTAANAEASPVEPSLPSTTHHRPAPSQNGTAPSQHAATSPTAPPPLDWDRLQPRSTPRKERTTIDPVFGLDYAPVFRPTEAEFQNPLAYIASIRHLAEPAGICKVIPPPSWKPPFALDTEKFSFPTRIQQLNAMNGTTRMNLNFLEAVAQFHAQNGTNKNRVPVVNGRPLNLHRLYKEVEKRGGFYKTTQRKQWGDVERALEIPSFRNATNSFSHIVRESYVRWILPFEIYCKRYSPQDYEEMVQVLEKRSGGIAAELLEQVEQEQTVSDEEHTSSSLRPNNIEDGGNDRTRLKTPPSQDLQEITPPVTASGRKRKATSPATATARRKSDRAPKPVLVEGETLRKPRYRSALVRPPEIQPDRPKPAHFVPGDFCETCHSDDRGESMLLCDGCNLGFHMDCLPIPVQQVPPEDWFCPKCLSTDDNFGFEEGHHRTLPEFQKIASDFKLHHFAKLMGKNAEEMTKAQQQAFLRSITEEDVEREFWRLSGNPYEHVDVEYGADLHSCNVGSGFPTAQTASSSNKFVRHGWNLNNIAKSPMSLLRFVGKDISGMVVPWLYVGMAFSTFCWHTEDHFTYSVNYLHWGDTKTWYGIPSTDAELFEQVMRKQVPDLFEAQPDLLFHITTMMSPEVLKQNGVRVVKCHQRWGEFVITFPRSYHAGFNQGFNFAEAVNFAPLDWLDFGDKCLSIYQQYHKLPVFSHDALLLKIMDQEPSVRNASWLEQRVQEMKRKELQRRADARARWMGMREELRPMQSEMSLVAAESVQCCHCKAFCFFSQVTCACRPENPYCLDHVMEGCNCLPKHKTLQLACTDRLFDQVLQRIHEILRPKANWLSQYETYLAQHPVVEIAAMKKFSLDAQRYGLEGPVVTNLLERTQRMLDWEYRAGQVLNARKPTRYAAGDRVTVKQISELLEEADAGRFDSKEVRKLQVRRKGMLVEWESACAAVEKRMYPRAECEALLERARVEEIPETNAAWMQLQGAVSRCVPVYSSNAHVATLSVLPSSDTSHPPVSR